MANAVIIHGTFGSPGENWFPWLSAQITALGHHAAVPTFPTPEGQSLARWREAFQRQIGTVSADTILIGHSLGAAFIFDILERSNVKVRATFLASAFVGHIGLPEFDSLNDSFVVRKFDWSRIRNRAGTISVFHGDNDPYVPIQKSWEVCNHLRVAPNIVHNGGHLNAEAGFTTFPQLWQILRPILENNRTRRSWFF